MAKQVSNDIFLTFVYLLYFLKIILFHYLHTLYTTSVYLYIYIYIQIHITAFEIRSIKVNVFSASSPQAVAIFSLSNRAAWMLGDLNINTLLYQKGNLYGCEPLSWRSDVSMYKFRKPFFAGFEIFQGKETRGRNIYCILDKSIASSLIDLNVQSSYFPSKKQTNERISVKIIFQFLLI